MRPLQFCEPIPVPDVYVSGIAKSEEIAPDLFRISYFKESTSLFDGRREAVIVAKFIMHRHNLVCAMRQAIWERHLNISELTKP